MKRSISKQIPVLSILSLLTVAPLALAVAPETREFPRCFDRDQGASLLFSWEEKNLFERKIYFVELDGQCDAYRKSRGTVVWDQMRELSWDQSSPNSAAALGLKDRQIQLLTQVRFGASVPRNEMDGKSFLSRHPISVFTSQVNRELTARYGIGFAGEVYQAFIESKAKNKLARDHFLKSMRIDGKLHREHTLLLVSMGLGWESDLSKHDDKTAFWVKDFANEIKSTGLETIFLQREAMGGVRDNVRLLKPQILKALESGNDLLLSGLCKGIPEMLMAWTELEEEAKRSGGRPARWGKIIGLVNMSGMNQGVYFADTVETTLLGRIVKFLAPIIPVSKDLSGSDPKAYARVLSTMTSEKSEEYRSEYVTRLPKDLPIVNVVGIIKGNGSLGDDRLLMNSFFAMNQKLDLLESANDGFIEYPGNELPQSEFSNAVTLAFEGSHMLTDGKAYSYDMKEAANRYRMYIALHRLALELAGK